MNLRVRLAMIASVSLLFTLFAPAANASLGPPASVAASVLAGPTAPAAKASGSASPIWRFYSPSYGGHFYTASNSERDRLISESPDVWQYEGQAYSAFTSPAPGTVPLYRFYSSSQKAHFFTASISERDRVRNTLSATWRYEGVAFHVYPNARVSGSIEMSRFWNIESRRHFYTASVTERDRVIRTLAHVWRFEGTNFAVPAGGVGAKVPPPNPGDSKNCGHFRNYAHAKAWFDLHYPYYGDIARLDNNKDRIPCEMLPGAP